MLIVVTENEVNGITPFMIIVMKLNGEVKTRGCENIKHQRICNKLASTVAFKGSRETSTIDVLMFFLQIEADKHGSALLLELPGVVELLY